jgi:hypothetical protein
MPLGFAFGKDLVLNIFGQTNVTVTFAMDVHEHSSADEEGVFVNSGMGFLGDTWQRKDSLAKRKI